MPGSRRFISIARPQRPLGLAPETPAKISPVTLEPLGEAFELLGQLARITEAAQIFDPADALVYAVDDDLDNCECIAMALEKVQHYRTKYAVRPEVALTEIVAAPCDLIILDVDMPRMDGFELASRIRQVAQHAATPIIFPQRPESARRQRLQDQRASRGHLHGEAVQPEGTRSGGARLILKSADGAGVTQRPARR